MFDLTLIRGLTPTAMCCRHFVAEVRKFKTRKRGTIPSTTPKNCASKSLAHASVTCFNGPLGAAEASYIASDGFRLLALTDRIFVFVN